MYRIRKNITLKNVRGLSMEYGCKDKTVVITGGTSGIGLAAARAFWLDGARVCIVGRDRGKGMKALAEIAGSAAAKLPVSAEMLGRLRYICGDVTKPASCRMASVVAAHYGEERIDILVNSAGIYQEKRIENTTVADYNQIMDVNVKGTLFMIQACQPYMLPHGEAGADAEDGAAAPAEDGSPAPDTNKRRASLADKDRCIINIASDAGIGGNYGCPVYCASKGAVVALTKALALDMAPDIRVNCICPGDVDTPLLAAQLKAAEGSYTKEEMGDGYPLGRIAGAEEVAHVICSVASPANSFMTGAVIPVDGGLTAIG